MPWKIPWQKDNPAGNEGKGSIYSLLRAVIGEMRRQGDHPVKDGESFSRYICDLCHNTAPVSALRQCVICGRWACRDCWKDEYYICSSCNGIMRLYLVEMPGCEKTADNETREPDQEIPVDEGDKMS
jgi:hypothetical protein